MTLRDYQQNGHDAGMRHCRRSTQSKVSKMIDEYGLKSNIPYTERELIQKSIIQATPFCKSEPRWVMVAHLFGTDRHISEAICTKYGFDPSQEVRSFFDAP